MSKMITIDGSRFVLPEGMTSKEIQTLAGLLISLVKVDYHYDHGSYEHFYYSTSGVQVGIGNVSLMTKEEAKAKSDESRAKEEARAAAKKTSEAAA